MKHLLNLIDLSTDDLIDEGCDVLDEVVTGLKP
jgi:hypothetical protein